MLPARPAAEIWSDNEKAGATVSRLVENEFWTFFARLVETKIVEYTFRQTVPCNAFQKLLGHDHVGVDVRRRKRRGNA
jgi:hypothetical protein